MIDPILAKLMVLFGEECRVEAVPNFECYVITEGTVQYGMDRVMAELVLADPDEAVEFIREQMRAYRERSA